MVISVVFTKYRFSCFFAENKKIFNIIKENNGVYAN